MTLYHDENIQLIDVLHAVEEVGEGMRAADCPAALIEQQNSIEQALLDMVYDADAEADDKGEGESVPCLVCHGTGRL